MLVESEFVKISTAVPADAAERVRQAMGKAGAGVQGNYSYCSGSVKSIGRFMPLPGAHPAIGALGKLEEVEEEITEMLCHKDKVKAVIGALRAAHPYEEPAIDIMPRYDIK